MPGNSFFIVIPAEVGEKTLSIVILAEADEGTLSIAIPAEAGIQCTTPFIPLPYRQTITVRRCLSVTWVLDASPGSPLDWPATHRDRLRDWPFEAGATVEANPFEMVPTPAESR